MSEISYTDGELWVKESLEKFFWIEIAKRKALLEELEVVEQLGGVRREIEEFFKFEGRGLDDPIDYGVEAVLNAVEFNRDITHYATNSDHQGLLKLAQANFESVIIRISSLLTYSRGFSLADFSTLNNLKSLYMWWRFISSSEGRRKLGTENTRFSSMGEARLKTWSDNDDPVNSEVPTITTLGCPVSFPIIVNDRPFCAFSTDDHDVMINGNPLTDHLILAFDLSKPLPPMRLVDMKLRSAHGSVRAMRILEMLQAGQFQNELLKTDDRESRFDITKLLVLSPEEFKLMKGPASPEPLILGLYSWDLVFNDELTVTQACRRTVQELFGDLDGESSISYFRKVKYALEKNVNPKIKRYDTSELPWLNWSV